MTTTITRPGAPVGAAIVGRVELLGADHSGQCFQVRDTRSYAVVGRIVRDCVDGVWRAFDRHEARVAEAATLRDVAVAFDRWLA